MYSVLAGSSARQSAGFEDSSTCCMVGFFAFASAAWARPALAMPSRANTQIPSPRKGIGRRPLALAAGLGCVDFDTGLAGIGMAAHDLEGWKSQD